MLLEVALVLFLLGAVAGLIMGVLSFRDRIIPPMLAVTHGFLVVCALTLVIVSVILGVVPMTLVLALFLFVLAAVAGFYLLTFHLRQEPHPRVVLVLHALLGVSGAGVLAYVIFLAA